MKLENVPVTLSDDQFLAAILILIIMGSYAAIGGFDLFVRRLRARRIADKPLENEGTQR